jgi:predicted Zn-dependent protease
MAIAIPSPAFRRPKIGASMKTRMLIASLAVLFAFAPPARAEVRTHDGAKITVDVPKGWKIEADEDSMTVTDPKEELAFYLQVLDVKDIKKAADAIDGEIGKQFQDVKWDEEPDTTKLNGMDAITLEGKAKVDGKPVHLGVAILMTPAKKALLVLGAVEADKEKKHEKDITSFFASLKPLK